MFLSYAGENRHPELFENITIRAVVPSWTAGTQVDMDVFRTHLAGLDAGIQAGMTESADEIKRDLDQLSGIVKL